MSLTESISNVSKLVVKVHDAEVKAKMLEALLDAQGEALDLQDRVARLQEEVARVQEENGELRRQIQAADRASEIAEQLYYARNAYWRKDEDILAAYCSGCWDTRKTLIRLARSGYAGACPSCSVTYEKAYDYAKRAKPGER